MSCENNVCGTGGWGGPQPGDPDNNITLHANTVQGGILVSWSYPLVNAFAVAYTDVYRSPSSNFDAAVLLNHAGGSSYLDPIHPTVDTECFYWIEVVSIHGTRGERLGPVMAVARPLALQTLESLTGLIDEGILSEALRQYIGGITLNNQAIYKEIQDRLASNAAFQQALADVQSGLTDSMTFIQTEITQRKTADSAFVDQLSIIAAAVGDAMAAILEEKIARVTQNQAFVQDYSALYARIGQAEGAITNILTLNIDPSTALATSMQNLATNVANAASAIQTLDTSLANGTHALAQSVKTVEATLYGNSATGQLGLEAKIDQKTGQISTIITAMTLVNGLAGGFGIANDGSVVEAGFDVDRFWVGRTSAEKIKPFIIDNGVVYIDKARIGTAWIDTLNVANGAITSAMSSFTAGSIEVQGGQYNGSAGNTVVQTLVHSSGGYPVLIGFGCAVEPAREYVPNSEGGQDLQVPSTWYVAIYRDGSELFRTKGPVSTPTGQGMSGHMYFQIQDAPSPGMHTYQMVVYMENWASRWGSCTSRIINALEVKR